MGDRSKIEWTDASWNPIRARNRATGKIGWHCTHASEGCRNCYAEAINRRLGTGLAYKPGHEPDIEIFLDPKMLTQPLRWRQPRKIFVGSMTDLFADFVPDAMIDQVFAVMLLCPQHTFQVLTKRPARMRALISGLTAQIDATCKAIGPRYLTRRPWSLSNVWLGVSAEDQLAFDERAAALLAMPAAVRFVSIEPMLGPIDGGNLLPGLDWVICGGESGLHARPMHPDWARSLRDQCQAAGVPFFFKQWGEWLDEQVATAQHCAPGPKMFDAEGEPTGDRWHFYFGEDIIGGAAIRIGKARAGRLLDGRSWDEFPAEARP
jgi:protein gp37